MQAKPTQDWTDDEAFWDEAWADMNDRLDGRRDRKGLAWWWVPLVLIVVGGLFWVMNDLSSSAPVPASSPNPGEKENKVSADARYARETETTDIAAGDSLLSAAPPPRIQCPPTPGNR